MESQEQGAAPEVQIIYAGCLRCRAKREMRNPKAIVLPNGRHGLEEKCPVCGTRMVRPGWGRNERT
jgi:hypothetical protein